MKRGYHRKSKSKSRSKSYDRHKSRRSTSRSRSREKHHKKNNSHNSTSIKEVGIRLGQAKMESDIRNHFRFKLPNLSTKEEEDTIVMLKSKLNEHIGPVEHITRSSREPTTLNLGFKYDIDALSFLQTGGLTIKTSSHKIHLDPAPTKAFQNIIKQREEPVTQKKQSRHKKSKHKSKSKSKSRSQSKSKSRSRSYSSSSSSRDKKKRYRSQSNSKSKSNSKQRSKAKAKKSKSKSRSRSKEAYLKVQIFGLPAYLSEEKATYMLAQGPGGPYKFLRSGWKKVSDTGCEYLELRMDSQKAERLVEQCNKIQVEGRPVVAVEESQRPAKQLLNYQVELTFPKPVHPSKVIKHLEAHAKVVQLVATQQFQQGGRSRGYLVTLNDRATVSGLRKLGQLSCGIRVSAPKHGQLVYRPQQPLPSRHQL